jgi:hypothetical protein
MRIRAVPLVLFLAAPALLAQQSAVSPAPPSGIAPEAHIVSRTVIPEMLPPDQISPETPLPNQIVPVGEMLVYYDHRGTPGPNRRQTFDAPDDWIKDLSISVQNRSGKTILGAGMQLTFTTPAANPAVVYSVQLGITPAHEVSTPSGPMVLPASGTPLSIPPGENVRFTLARDYSAIRSAIEAKESLAQITSVSISYGTFYFDGGLRWQPNTFSRVDPASPGRYIPAVAKDFMMAPDQRLIGIAPFNPRDAVSVTSVSVDGKEVTSKRSFTASQDWIANTVIVARNNSSKVLECLEFQVSFQEFGGHFSNYVVGHLPASARYDRAGVLHEIPATPISIAPGATLRIPLNTYLDKLSRELQDINVAPPDAHVIQIGIINAYFDDGTRWQWDVPSRYSKPDPEHPGRWIDISPEEFGPVKSGR